ncbi:MAG: hypothetical protein BAJALOKI3v1_130012 [Promethearchaeota archaeon]|nr:MAG: hypothetical protein BAJALOKI3v1_130012 [Candidatus Lokiarchaeota archaeon]
MVQKCIRERDDIQLYYSKTYKREKKRENRKFFETDLVFSIRKFIFSKKNFFKPVRFTILHGFRTR